MIRTFRQVEMELDQINWDLNYINSRKNKFETHTQSGDTSAAHFVKCDCKNRTGSVRWRLTSILGDLEARQIPRSDDLKRKCSEFLKEFPSLWCLEYSND
jgi:hypothetical protein